MFDCGVDSHCMGLVAVICHGTQELWPRDTAELKSPSWSHVAGSRAGSRAGSLQVIFFFNISHNRQGQMSPLQCWFSLKSFMVPGKVQNACQFGIFDSKGSVHELRYICTTKTTNLTLSLAMSLTRARTFGPRADHIQDQHKLSRLQWLLLGE